MLTPKQIQDLADPIESVYIHIVDELLVNIGKHITSPTWTHTASWEIQKLSEMGQLTAENAAIINKWIKQIPPEMRATMEATRAAALDRIEQQLEQAAKAGYVTPPVRDSTIDVLRDMSEQAADKLNLVNTTMLQSSLDQYSRAVQLTEAEIKRAEATQGILNEAAASVATGTETRTQAVRRAILRISDEGLTGFIDKAGRSWTPEAYVNTVVRTTVHNTAIQSTKARMEDYGTEVFQISSHAGARPLCYPYQGWFCSWDNSSGEIELGDGRTVKYVPLRDTSYGEPAGIFGINCGHFPIPIIPGVTIPHGADNIQPKEENDREYAESQEQRAIERQIREAKRVVEMAGPTATKEDKERVKALQAEMREFINRTGRTRRYDRESISGAGQGKGGTKEPEKEQPRRSVVEQVGAVEYDSRALRNVFGDNLDGIDWGGVTELPEAEAKARAIEMTLAEMQRRYPMQGSGNVQYRSTVDAVTICDYSEVGRHLPNSDLDQRIDRDWGVMGQVFQNAIMRGGKEINSAVVGFDRDMLITQTVAEVIKEREERLAAGNILWSVGGQNAECVAMHEWGHIYAEHLTSAMINSSATASEYWEWYKTLTKDEIREGISDYATENRGEFEAECFLEMQMPNPRPLAVKYWDFMQRAIDEGF